MAGSIAGRTIINTATVSPSYSTALEADIRAVGGHYVGMTGLAEAANFAKARGLDMGTWGSIVKRP